jgi:hypothetical protein
MASLQEQFQNAFARNAVNAFNDDVARFADNLTKVVTDYIEKESIKNSFENRGSGKIQVAGINVTNFTPAEIHNLSSATVLHKACAKPENNIAVVVTIEDYPNSSRINGNDRMLTVSIDLNQPYTAPQAKPPAQAVRPASMSSH